MKRYTTPELVAVGRVIDRTQGVNEGAIDGGGTQQLFSAGSIGFNL